jgi:hypothetical protein
MTLGLLPVNCFDDALAQGHNAPKQKRAGALGENQNPLLPPSAFGCYADLNLMGSTIQKACGQRHIALPLLLAIALLSREPSSP